jgi:hypothetical protein
MLSEELWYVQAVAVFALCGFGTMMFTFAIQLLRGKL